MIRLLALLLGCVAGVAASDGAGLLSPSDLQKAEKLDRKKCWRCHKPYDPRRYGDAEWQDWMDKMSRKARLKSAEDVLLRRYFDQKRDAAALVADD